MTASVRALSCCYCLIVIVSASSCDSRSRAADASSSFAAAAAESAAFVERVAGTCAAAGLPAALSASVAAAARDGRPSFEASVAAALAGDAYLTVLVDKKHPLPEGYAPSGLVSLDGYRRPDGASASFTVNRPGHKLRAPAAAALERMAEAARGDGVVLVVSSAYRSEAYQKTVYERIVRELGQEGADRESARPGRSQHQLGMAVDFGSITDAFAETAASRWLQSNAGRFGWSLSFPRGYEEATGYRWESWHYRYVGEAAAALIDRYFDGVQQYGIEFLAAWGK